MPERLAPGDKEVGSCTYDYGRMITTEAAPSPSPSPSPTEHHHPNPPLAPYPNPLQRQKQKETDCNQMVKQALDMSRTLTYCASHYDRAGENAVTPEYIRHIKKMGERCGQPLQYLHHDYLHELTKGNALDVYDGSGAPIAQRSVNIAVELTRRNRMWDQHVLRNQLTWTDWFINAMGRRPRW
jgi:hypothetical protein